MTLTKLLPTTLLVMFSLFTSVSQAIPGRFEPVNRQVINCSSSGYRYNTCYVGDIDYVRLVRQVSRSACIEGSTWGYDYDYIWVDQGCRADFEVISRRGGGGYYPPPRNDSWTCVANDRGTEEHYGGHEGYGRSQYEAAQNAIAVCKLSHGECYISTCTQR